MNKALEQKMVERWPTWFNTGGRHQAHLDAEGVTHDEPLVRHSAVAL